MKRMLTWGAMPGVLAFALSAWGADSALPSIEHLPGSCIAPGAWPRIEARVSDTGEKGRAHVLFHAADSPHWYSVTMRASEGIWSATLPRPTERASRFAYFIVAENTSGEARLPGSSAFVVDVSRDCGDRTLPLGEKGPEVLGLVRGAPRTTPDFDLGSVLGFVEGSVFATLASAPSSGGWAPPVRGQVRIRTVDPRTVRGEVTGEDRRTVSVRVTDGEEPVTLTREDWLEGQVQSSDEEGLVLRVGGRGLVRVRHQDVVDMESRQPGSPGMGVLGALGGATVGVLATVLVCASAAELCTGVEVLWAGMIVGAVAGGSAAGSGGWQSVPALSTRRVALAVKPMPRGGAVGLQIGF